MVESHTVSVTPATHAERHVIGGIDHLENPLLLHASRHEVGGDDPVTIDSIPSGVILMWSGSIATIPTGYVICDGTNSTPDLRDRFVVGAGTTYAVDATGGSTTHSHGSKNVNQTAQTAVATTAAANHLPPYYALAYIMKS